MKLLLAKLFILFLILLHICTEQCIFICQPNNIGLYLCECICAKLLQSCPALCYPMECSPPDTSVHGILQARILEWVAHALLQGIFPTQGLKLRLLNLPTLTGGFFTTSSTREAIYICVLSYITFLSYCVNSDQQSSWLMTET